MSTEQLANWVLEHGFATGHGDSIAPGWGRGSLIRVDSKNFQDLCEEVLDLRQKVSQRGARLQVMREWMESRNQMGTNNDWTEFCRERPAASQWFDEHGVPK